MIVKGKNGYKYSKKSNFSVLINMASALFLDTEKYSDKEVMAVLLHEIGHSFDVCNKDCIKMVQNARASQIVMLAMKVVISIISIFRGDLSGVANLPQTILVSTNIGKRVQASSIRTALESDSSFVKLQSLIQIYGNNVMTGIFNFIGLIFRATGIKSILNFLLIPISWIDKNITKFTQSKSSSITTGRVKEYLADSFPMMYGYGAYQTSALEKMCYNTNSKNDEIVNKIPLIGKLDQISNYHLFVLAETFSTHPSLAARTNNMTKELEGELKKANLPPKMKKQIEANLKDLKEFRDKVRDESKIAHDDPKRYRKAWLAVAMALDDDSTRVSKYEKDYVDMETRDEYYDKLIEEQNRISLDDLELI